MSEKYGIGLSPSTGNIYAGKRLKSGMLSSDKTEITDEIIDLIVTRWPGTEKVKEITVDGKPKYIVEVYPAEEYGRRVKESELIRLAEKIVSVSPFGPHPDYPEDDDLLLCRYCKALKDKTLEYPHNDGCPHAEAAHLIEELGGG